MKKEKGLIIGIIILAALVIIVFYGMSSNKAPTANQSQSLQGLSYSPWTPLLIPNSNSNNFSSQNTSGFTTSGNETVTYEGAPVI